MSRVPLVASLSLLACALALAGTEKPAGPPRESDARPSQESPSKPLMELRLSVRNGMRPLEVKLVGEIKVPSGQSMKTCHVQADWTNTTGIGLPFTTRDMIPCVKPPAEVPVPEAFEQALFLEKAGTYSYRIILEDREGKRYASMSKEVEVKESGFQIDATRDRNEGQGVSKP